MKPRVAVIILLTVLCIPVLAAQKPDTERILRLYCDGLFTDAILESNRKLAELEKPDETLLYIRAASKYHIGWYAEAKQELIALGDYEPPGELSSPASLLDRIAQIEPCLPVNIHDIRDRDTVIFRVRYETNNRWTQAIVDALSEAYQKVSHWYGRADFAIPVMIYRHRKPFEDYYHARSTSRRLEHAWASGGCQGLCFCQATAAEAEGSVPYYQSGDFRITIAHELSHCVLHRFLGGVGCPTWLDEGIAELCGGLMDEDALQHNDFAIKNMLRNDRGLRMDALMNPATWSSNLSTATDCYAQSYGMVRFIERMEGPEGIFALINNLRETGDIDQAFAETWGITLYDFYDMWLQDEMTWLEETD